MKILHLEDNQHDAELVAESLAISHGCFEITRVETRTAFSKALETGGWDVLLADYSLPGFDGISALELATGRCPETPFIFVSGTLGEERAVAALKSGATDHVLKHRLDRLPHAVSRALRESRSVRAREDAEKATRVSLREAELLLQEVHHRVNNNFQIICSLLNLQAQAACDPQLASILQRSLKRIDAMAKAHAMLYAAASLQDIDFAEYVRTMATDVQRVHAGNASPVRLLLDVKPVRLEIGRAIPSGLILNELLSNAFRHGFPDGRKGEVRVSLSRAEGEVRLIVEDDGVGLPEGHDLISATSVGFSIVNVLVRQLRGTLESVSGQSSRFELRFT